MTPSSGTRGPSRRTREPEVLLWDSNPFNPYGAEVARVIRAGGRCCRRICRSSSVYDNAQDHGWLPPSRQAGNRVLHRLHYVAGLARTTGLVLRRRPVVVVPWSNTRYELVMVMLWQLLGVRTVLLSHNPIPRRQSGMGSGLERRLRRRATHIVVHSAQHVNNTEAPERTRVVAHPAYFGWVDRHLVPSDHQKDGPKSALWFGAAREDKGFSMLPALGEQLATRGIQLVVAIGVMTAEQSARLAQAPTLHVIASGGYVDDSTLARCLAGCDVLVAPYRDVTASGTVLMALSSGLPVAAFDHAALQGLLPSAAMVADGRLDLLAASCLSATRDQDPVTIARLQDARSLDGWQRLLSEICGPAVWPAEP